MGDIVEACEHGLTRAFCDDCKWRADVGSLGWDTRPWPDGPVTTAKFESDCPTCGMVIEEGVDHVWLRDHDWVCIDCANEHDERVSNGV